LAALPAVPISCRPRAFAHRQRALEKVLRCHALEHHAGRGVERDALGQPHHVLRRHHTLLAVAARRVAGVGGAVAGLEVRDTLAHGLDDAGTFHAQRERQRVLVQARALVDVDVVQPRGVVADADLARARLAHRQVDELQLFGATVGGDLDRAGHVLCSGVVGRPRRLRQTSRPRARSAL
jgi:hypothetical protein